MARSESNSGRSTVGPKPSIGVWDAAAMTVGIVLGAGIYRSPSLVAAQSASSGEMLGAWALGGLISLVGALCYAELSAAFPNAGGEYHYLRRAFGRHFAFLYGWSRLAIIQTGSIALLAYVYGDYASALLPLGQWSSSIHAAIAVLGITAVNWVGVAFGCRVQRWLTLVEVGGLVLVIVAGLIVAPEAAPSPGTKGGALGLALVFVLLTYGGWNESAYLSAELRDNRRLMMPVLVGSLALLTILYLLANAAYVRALGLGGMAESDVVAADVMRLAWGGGGAALISIAVAVAALTSANATAFTGARSAYALGADFPAFRFLGQWRAHGQTPGNAFLFQGVDAMLLVGVGAFARDGFQLAVEYTAPAFWFFFLAVGVALFVLRRREPDIERPFRVPLYPVVPAIFCLTSLYLLYSSLAYTGAGAWVGGAVLIVGGLVSIVAGRAPAHVSSAP